MFEPKLLPNIRVNENDLTIKVWDTPGFADYRQQVIDFITNADFVYVVIDVAPKLNDSIKEYINNMWNQIKENARGNCKIVFLLSKYDLSDRAITNTVDYHTLLSNLIRTRPGTEFYCVSALPLNQQYRGECEEYRTIARLKESMIQHLTGMYSNLSDKEDYLPIPIINTREEEERRREEERLKRENEEKNREIERLRAEQNNRDNKNGGSCVIL